jgi:hypothetical protein
VRGSENYVKIDLTEIGRESLDWIQLAVDRIEERGLFLTRYKLSDSIKSGVLLARLKEIVSFGGITLLLGAGRVVGHPVN